MRVIQGIADDTVAIASGSSLSAAVNLQGRTLCGIQMPGTWTAANLTFQGAVTEGGTFTDIYDDAGVEYLVTAAASRWIPLDPAAFLGSNFMKIRSGTTGVAVNQGADRVLAILMAEMD